MHASVVSTADGLGATSSIRLLDSLRASVTTSVVAGGLGTGRVPVGLRVTKNGFHPRLDKGTQTVLITKVVNVVITDTSKVIVDLPQAEPVRTLDLITLVIGPGRGGVGSLGEVMNRRYSDIILLQVWGSRGQGRSQGGCSGNQEGD